MICAARPNGLSPIVKYFPVSEESYLLTWLDDEGINGVLVPKDKINEYTLSYFTGQPLEIDNLRVAGTTIHIRDVVNNGAVCDGKVMKYNCRYCGDEKLPVSEPENVPLIGVDGKEHFVTVGWRIVCPSCSQGPSALFTEDAVYTVGTDYIKAI
jgi:hypothetical protein